MSGLTDRAGGEPPRVPGDAEQARRRWEESMLQQLDRLREQVAARPAETTARLAGASCTAEELRFPHWGRTVRVAWPSLDLCWEDSGAPVGTFDAAMLLYYLRQADGTDFADRWIGFRELPDGGFYHLAYQGYTGNRLAAAFGADPQAFDRAARKLECWPLPALAEHAFAFLPLPRVRLAAILWPGDEEFPARAAVLFDAAAPHHMTTDGLALLGSGLTGRLIKAAG